MRKQRAQNQDQPTSDAGCRLHPGHKTDDCKLHRQPAKDDKAGREGSQTGAPQASEHRERGDNERAAHDNEENEARNKIVRERASLEPFRRDALSARQSIVAAPEGVYGAEGE